MLLLLLACNLFVSPSGETYDACARQLEVSCDCGNAQTDPKNVYGACDTTAEEWCARYDMRVCDPEGDRWDADGCEAVHDQIDGIADYPMDCISSDVRANCPPAGSDAETVWAVWQAAEAACE